MQTDYYIFQQINGLARHFAWLDWLGIFLASYCQYLVAGALLLFVLASKTQKEEVSRAWMAALAFLAALAARYGVASALHHIFFRPRPFMTHQVNQLMTYAADKSSWPSGHAAFFFGLAIVVFLYEKKIYPERSRRVGGWFLAMALLISLARVYVGVHYPSDILAGALIGLFTGWVVWATAKKIELIN